MTIRVNSEFATLLNAANTTNNNWSTAYKNGLGNIKQIICKSAPSGTAQANIFAFGTEFRRGQLVGDIIIEGGIVTRYGKVKNLTVCTAVNLAAEVAVLRIVGDTGNWVEGTIGLVGSNCDFILRTNPSTNNGFSISPNMRVKPPVYLPSGTGYVAPDLDLEAPKYLVIKDWRNANNPTEVGRIPFDKRVDNWTFTDDEVASNMGDIRGTLSTKKVVFVDIEFGACLFSSNGNVNSETNVPVHQVIVFMKATETNWKGYPRSSGYRMGTRVIDNTNVKYGMSNTFPEAFKAELYNGKNELIHTFDMDKDHLPINSTELQDFPSKSKPLRLNMHCAQMLMWESHTPKRSTITKKLFPGLDMRNVRPGMHKERASYAGRYLPFDVGGNVHGLEHWFAHPLWAHAASSEADAADPHKRDPYLWVDDTAMGTPEWAKLWNLSTAEYGVNPYKSNVMGLGYEPGGQCGHNWSTGPGGVRIDRGAMAGPTMIHLTDPTWVHLRTGLSIDVLHKHWAKGYFNHAVHFFQGEINEMNSIPVEEVLTGKWASNYTYYKTDATTYTKGGADYAIPWFAAPGTFTYKGNQPHAGVFTDTRYRLPWSGYSLDWLHDYSSPADVALHYNSPAHAYSAKHRYLISLMCSQAYATKPDASATSYFGSRQHAWKLLQHARMWKLASDHPIFGVPRGLIEARLVTELTQVYKEFYIPMWVENVQTTEMQALKRFGVPIGWSEGSAKWTAQSFNLTFYMGGVLRFMRQCGLFNKLWNMGEIPQKALLTIIKLLDAGAIQWYTQTKGSYMNATGGGKVFDGPPYIPLDHTTKDNPTLPKDWKEWRDVKWPLQGQEDLIHNADGTFSSFDSSDNLRQQWPAIRYYYFDDIECEFPMSEVKLAVDIVNDFHNQWQAKMDKHKEENLPLNSYRLREWSCPVPYAQSMVPDPTLVEKFK